MSDSNTSLRPISFTTGIDNISFEDQAPISYLPKASPIPPHEQRIDSEVQKVLKMPSWTSRILDILAPNITNPSILQPSEYRTMIDQIPCRLEALKNSKDNNVQSEKKDEVADSFSNLRDLFSKEEELFNLLDQYRYALHQV